MTSMSYTEMAQLELMNAAANVTSQADLDALCITGSDPLYHGVRPPDTRAAMNRQTFF